MSHKWKWCVIDCTGHAIKGMNRRAVVHRAEADKALAEAEARIKKLIEHHRLVCNEICGNCDDFECPARGRS